MSSLVWGVFVVMIGLSIIAKAVFGLDIPVIKIALGCFFIYLGLNIMLDTPSITFGTGRFQSRIKHYKETGYTNVFGSETIDLSTAQYPACPVKIKVNTAFGNTKIILNKDIPTQIKVNAVSSTVNMPHDELELVANHVYGMGDSQQKPLLLLVINATFATVTVETR